MLGATEPTLFSVGEKRQDLFLGIAFLLITAFSSVRIFRNWSPTGGRKVITMFNLLIFVASAIRTVWFLLPNEWLESSYTPRPVVAFAGNEWVGTLISEVLLVAGSLSLYGIFILVACYWVNMLQKLNSNVGTSGTTSGFARFKTQRLGAIETFTIIMSVIGACQGLSIVLFLTGVFNSEQMILYDAVMLSVVSVAVVAEITILSIQIRKVLENLEVINNRNSQPQIRRIFAIIVVANVFFVTRVVLEVTLAVYMGQLMRDQHSIAVVMSDKYWALYILLKHLCEVVVLTLELIISTAIKSYDSRAQPVLHTHSAGGSSASNSSGVIVGSGGGVNAYTGTGGTSGAIPTHQVNNTNTLPTRPVARYTPISTYQPGAMSSNTTTTINVPLVSVVDNTTGYGATDSTKFYNTGSGANSTGNRGSGGGGGGGKGRYNEDYGVELTTERTPMLHQYDASGSNEV